MENFYIPQAIAVYGTATAIGHGRKRRTRYLSVIDGKQLFLSPIPFRLFAILAMCRLSRRNDGWVKADVLYGQTAGVISRYLYTLRRLVQADVPCPRSKKPWPVVENDHWDRHGHRGEYRLLADPGAITIDMEGIRSFGQHDMTQMLDTFNAPQ
jgi:hypothetical protein